MVVLIYILAFAASTAVIGLAYSLYRIRQIRLFRYYIYYLVLLDVCVLINLFFTYLERVMPGTGFMGSSEAVEVIIDLTGTAFGGGIVYWQVQAIYGTLFRNPLPALRGILVGLVILGVVATAFLALLDPPWFTGSLFDVARIVNLLIIAIAAIVNLHVFIFTLARKDDYPQIVRLFAGFHLVVFVALLVGFFLPLPIASPLLAVIFLAMNLIPLALLRGLHSHLYLRRATAPLGCEELDEFAEMYGISTREMEIVAQILTGRTNAEIAEKLFISVSTAKNHIHNIYRKCGIRNRVELAMLVKEAGNDSS